MQSFNDQWYQIVLLFMFLSFKCLLFFTEIQTNDVKTQQRWYIDYVNMLCKLAATQVHTNSLIVIKSWKILYAIIHWGFNDFTMGWSFMLNILPRAKAHKGPTRSNI